MGKIQFKTKLIYPTYPIDVLNFDGSTSLNTFDVMRDINGIMDISFKLWLDKDTSYNNPLLSYNAGSSPNDQTISIFLLNSSIYIGQQYNGVHKSYSIVGKHSQILDCNIRKNESGTENFNFFTINGVEQTAGGSLTVTSSSVYPAIGQGQKNYINGTLNDKLKDATLWDFRITEVSTGIRKHWLKGFKDASNDIGWVDNITGNSDIHIGFTKSVYNEAGSEYNGDGSYSCQPNAVPYAVGSWYKAPSPITFNKVDVRMWGTSSTAGQIRVYKGNNYTYPGSYILYCTSLNLLKTVHYGVGSFPTDISGFITITLDSSTSLSTNEGLFVIADSSASTITIPKWNAIGSSRLGLILSVNASSYAANMTFGSAGYYQTPLKLYNDVSATELLPTQRTIEGARIDDKNLLLVGKNVHDNNNLVLVNEDASTVYHNYTSVHFWRESGEILFLGTDNGEVYQCVVGEQIDLSNISLIDQAAPGTSITDIYVEEFGRGYYISSDTGDVKYTRNGGDTWTTSSGINSYVYRKAFIFPTSYSIDSSIYFTSAGWPFKSNNYGESMSAMLSVDAFNATDVNFSTINNGWMCLYDGSICNTINAGSVWTGRPLSTTRLNGITSFYGDNSTFIICGEEGKIYRTTDNSTWSLINSSTNLPLKAIGTNGNDAWIVGGNDASGGIILRSENKGASWNELKYLPEYGYFSLPYKMNDVYAYGAAVVFVGDHNQVLRYYYP